MGSGRCGGQITGCVAWLSLASACIIVRQRKRWIFACVLRNQPMRKFCFDVLGEVRLTWAEEKRTVGRWPKICRRVANGTWGFSRGGSHMIAS